MGISDKDYADALSYYKLQQAQAQQQNEERKQQMLGAITSAIGLGNAGTVTLGASTTTGALHYPSNAAQNAYTQQTTIGIKPLREEDLKHEAMQVPLSVLADMWTMRWDTQWVNEQEFMDDDFWRLALLRLLGASKLEKHNLVNQYHAVYRIIT